MKKLFKGLFTTALAVGFLAGCKPTPSSSEPPVSSSEAVVVKHTVEFYEDNVGKFYLEVEVVHGEKVSKPADPTARSNYEFAGWWVDEEYSAEFDFNTLIIEDTSIFGKWEFAPEYIADTRTFHIVGALNNTALDFINWKDAGEEGVDWQVESYLEKDEDSNLYSIELEIGYLGKFKIKVPGRPWDSDTEFNFTHIRTEDMKDYLKEGDSKNIQVTDSGKYLIEVESTYLWARVTRLGEATGEGVTHNTGAKPQYGIVGDQTNWGNADKDDVVLPDIPMNFDEENNYYYLPIVYLEEGEIKLRADNAWSMEFGSHPNNELPEGITQPKAGDPAVVEENKNLTVVTAGYYSVYFKVDKIIIHELSFVLRGSMFGTDWGEDSEPLTLISSVPNEEAGTDVLTFEGNFEMAAGQFKVKLASLGDYAGWNISFGVGDGNFIVETDGEYTVTLVLTIDVETLAYTGVASFAPVAA